MPGFLCPWRASRAVACHRPLQSQDLTEDAVLTLSLREWVDQWANSGQAVEWCLLQGFIAGEGPGRNGAKLSGPVPSSLCNGRHSDQ
jgi:hypothetical protein